MTDCGFERWAIEQSGCQNVKRVEPTAGLTHVFNDVVARVVGFKPLAVFERIVNLGERHRT